MEGHREVVLNVPDRRSEAISGPVVLERVANKALREAELELARQAETAYRRLVSDRQPKKGAGATAGRASSKPSSGKQRGRASVPDPAL